MPKEEYNNTISNMDLRWTGEIETTEDRDEASILLVKIVWAFQRIRDRQLSNLDDDSVFQDEIYKNIDPKTANAIIVATHCPKSAMHNISTSFNHLPINFDKESYW